MGRDEKEMKPEPTKMSISRPVEKIVSKVVKTSQQSFFVIPMILFTSVWCIGYLVGKSPDFGFLAMDIVCVVSYFVEQRFFK